MMSGSSRPCGRLPSCGSGRGIIASRVNQSLFPPSVVVLCSAAVDRNDFKRALSIVAFVVLAIAAFMVLRVGLAALSRVFYYGVLGVLSVAVAATVMRYLRRNGDS